MNITITSPAFNHNDNIPSKYTCDGENFSPALSWSDIPENIKTLALIVDDPDAPGGDFVHWIVYNIPVSTKGLDEKITNTNLPVNAAMGTNDFRRIGYDGPCPPSGTHRYFFKIYAIDTILQLDAGVNKKQLLKAMEGHILAKGEMVGKYA